MFGQWIFISPQQNVVVTTTANNEGANAVREIEFLYSVLGSMRR